MLGPNRARWNLLWGNPLMTVNPPVCEFPWLLAPLYKQVEVQQGWQEQQAAGRHWLEHSCVCRGNDWLQQQEHGPAFPAGAPGAAPVRLLGRWVTSAVPSAKGSRCCSQLEGNGFSKICCHIPSSVRELDAWGWTLSALDSRAAWAKWGLFTLLLSFTPAQSNQDCCLSYTKVRLPRWVLKGYTEQLSSEVCDIPAIM